MSLEPTIPLTDRIQIIQSDLTTLHVDAIVNPANPALAPGGALSGAIHRTAGPELAEDCRRQAPLGCHTGHAVLTQGRKLPAAFVIHAVGPVWEDGQHSERELLAQTYRNCLQIAHKKEIETLAFPAISTGVYAFPLEDATRIALHEVLSFLKNHRYPQQVTFCTFDSATLKLYQETYQMYREALSESATGPKLMEAAKSGRPNPESPDDHARVIG